MTKWKKITEKRYEYMLNVIMPLNWDMGRGFQVNEPVDVDAKGHYTFDSFMRLDGSFYESCEPMTQTAFRAVTVSSLRKDMTEAYEVVDNIKPPKFKDITHCYNWLKQLMPNENINVREDAAIILWNKQMCAALRAHIATMEARTDRRMD